MKLVNKTIFSLIVLGILAVSYCSPVYEAPLILKKGQPFNQPVNPRIDNMNDSSANNYKRYLDRKLRSKVNKELGKNFDLENFKKWLDYYENEKLTENTNGEMVENVGNILAKSIELQSYINFRAGLVSKELALLDMKLKQIEALEATVINITQHPGDINSKLGNNYLWKQNLDDVLLESASIDSNYSLAWGSICEVLDLKDHVTKSVVSSKHVRKSNIERIYYPDQEFLRYKRGIDFNDEDEKSFPLPDKRDPIDLKRGKAETKAEKPKVEASFIERSKPMKKKPAKKPAKKTVKGKGKPKRAPIQKPKHKKN